MKDKLQIGDVIRIEPGMRVYARVPEHFLFANRKGVFDKTSHGEIAVGGELSYFAGEYVVTDARMEGGGTGTTRCISDGWHVTCMHLENARTIDFYQSGAFSCMLPDIQPIGKATQQVNWTRVS